MANRQFHDLQHANELVRLLDFSFVPNGTDDPDPTLIKGEGVESVEYSTTGTWIVTLRDVYPYVLRPPVYSVQRAAPPAKAVDFFTLAETITSDGKFTVQYREDHVAADIAANTNTRIGINLALTNLAPVT